MLAAVQPRSDGWSGGSYTRAGLPTAPSGGGFGAPGAPASTPTSVPTAAVKEARNNQGTNVQIPYTRVVPLHQRAAHKAEGTPGGASRSMVIDGVSVVEYENLRKGTLAWVLGRRYKRIPISDAGGSPDDPGGSQQGVPPPVPVGQDPALVDPRRNEIDELNESQRYAHQAHAGVGNGVDRMQRLASTDWVETMFQERAMFERVELHSINLFSDRMRAVSGDQNTLSMFAGSTAIYTFDAVQLMASINNANGSVSDIGRDVAINAPEQMQGVFVAEAGPFLRGIQADSRAIPLGAVRGVTSAMDAPRNMGTNFVFEAIEEEIRRRNLMDWTPDGIVLSKLESPSGEPEKSTALDSRDAQLFNVGVQGPALTTTWTSDIRDSKLVCQPLDKVFICLVADLSWITDNADMAADVTTARAAHRTVLVTAGALDRALRMQPPPNSSPAELANYNARVAAFKTQLDIDLAAAKAAADAVITAANGVADPGHLQLVTELSFLRTLNNSGVLERVPLADINLQGRADALETARRDLDNFYDFPDSPAVMADFEEIQHKIRIGASLVSKAILSNFRLMRSTSSHMANYSHFVPKKPDSRCGLRLGSPRDLGGGNFEGGGEYIVGAWCIGTVLDSAASRSMVGNNVRTSATSMELNLNVDISWWSGDKLYKHYMDVHGQVTGRGQRPAPTRAGRPATGAEALNRANNDVEMHADAELGQNNPGIDAPVASRSSITRAEVEGRRQRSAAQISAGQGESILRRVVKPRRA